MQENPPAPLHDPSHYIFDISMAGVSFWQYWQMRLMYNNVRTVSNITMTQQNIPYLREKHQDTWNFVKGRSLKAPQDVTAQV